MASLMRREPRHDVVEVFDRFDRMYPSSSFCGCGVRARDGISRVVVG